MEMVSLRAASRASIRYACGRQQVRIHHYGNGWYGLFEPAGVYAGSYEQQSRPFLRQCQWHHYGNSFGWNGRPYRYFVEGELAGTGATGVVSRPAGNFNITVLDDAGCTFSLNTITLTAPASPAPRWRPARPRFVPAKPCPNLRQPVPASVVRQQQRAGGSTQPSRRRSATRRPDVQLLGHADGLRCESTKTT
jgi:hypothetical protein